MSESEHSQELVITVVTSFVEAMAAVFEDASQENDPSARLNKLRANFATLDAMLPDAVGLHPRST